MKKLIIIIGLLALTNCAYKPKINPEFDEKSTKSRFEATDSILKPVILN